MTHSILLYLFSWGIRRNRHTFIQLYCRKKYFPFSIVFAHRLKTGTMKLLNSINEDEPIDWMANMVNTIFLCFYALLSIDNCNYTYSTLLRYINDKKLVRISRHIIVELK